MNEGTKSVKEKKRTKVTLSYLFTKLPKDQAIERKWKKSLACTYWKNLARQRQRGYKNINLGGPIKYTSEKKKATLSHIKKNPNWQPYKKIIPHL